MVVPDMEQVLKNEEQQQQRRSQQSLEVRVWVSEQFLRIFSSLKLLVRTNTPEAIRVLNAKKVSGCVPMFPANVAFSRVRVGVCQRSHALTHARGPQLSCFGSKGASRPQRRPPLVEEEEEGGESLRCR